MTESGVNFSLERVAPGKKFHYVTNENCNCSECPYMRLNTLEKLRDALLQSRTARRTAGGRSCAAPASRLSVCWL